MSLFIGAFNQEYTDLEKPFTFSITMYAYLYKLINGNLELTEHIDSCYALIKEMKLMDFAVADTPFINYFKIIYYSKKRIVQPHKQNQLKSISWFTHFKPYNKMLIYLDQIF